MSTAMFDEAHPPVNPREIDWRDHILGLPNDEPQETRLPIDDTPIELKDIDLSERPF